MDREELIKKLLGAMQRREYRVVPFGYMFRALVSVVTMEGAETKSLGMFGSEGEAKAACERDLDEAKAESMAAQQAVMSEGLDPKEKN